MPITQEQREQRRQFIGSSDVAAIFGVDPWQTAYDVWASKVWGLDEKSAEALSLGNRLESALAAELAERLGEERFFTDPPTMLHPDHNFMGVNLDVIFDRKDFFGEIKTSGLAHYTPTAYTEWGDPGTDQVPDHILCQVTYQMLVTGLKTCFIGALLAGRGFNVFKVDYSPAFGDKIEKAVTRFWTWNVLCQVAPSDEPSLDVVKRIRREPGRKTVIDPGTVARYQVLDKAAKAVAKKADAAKARVIATLEDGEEGYYDEGCLATDEPPAVTYYANKSGARTLRLKEPIQGENGQ